MVASCRRMKADKGFSKKSTSPTRMFSLENEVKKRTAPEKQIHQSFIPKGP